MKKRHVKKVRRTTSRKLCGLFKTKNDWFLWVAATVFISFSIFILFGLLPI